MGEKEYTIAGYVTNPLSAVVKYGGGLEYRKRNLSYTFGYFKYTGAYFGAQYDAGMNFFLRNKWIHRNNDWIYQDFFYYRTIFGEAGYDGQKFAFLGQKEDRFAEKQAYGGLALGFGRRYHKGVFFVNIRGGVRAIYLGIDREIKSLYRLFYVTGPGSIVEVNFQFGIQL